MIAESVHPRQPSVVVLQMGARLHYGVPAVFARAGVLRALYTDACASVGSLALLRRLVPPAFRGPTLRRLLGRTLPPGIRPDQVRVATAATLLERASRRLSHRPAALSETLKLLQNRLRHSGFEGADVLYSLDNSDLPLLREAKAAGLKVIYEQIITPLVGRILREERELFPGIEPQEPVAAIEEGIARDTEVFRLADAIICASPFVHEHVSALAGPGSNARVVEYGIGEEWLELPNTPRPGRVLFVGAVGLRKGAHYVAHAARLLSQRGVPCEVRAVGPLSVDVRRPLFAGPTYVGSVPRDAVRAEFAQADLFVLPSLAEGSALAHLEALAYGLPVIATPNCGSYVRDGVDGFIVPLRSAEALADRIEQIVTDRDLRDRLGRNAKARAREFTWAAFGRKLLSVTQDVMVKAPQRVTG